MSTFVVVDFETTGLVLPRAHWDRQPGITQIGAIRSSHAEWKALNTMETLNFLINPEIPESSWSPEAIEVSGITPEMVADKSSLFGSFQEITDFFLGAEIWVGYNTDFDQNVLYHQLHRYGLEKNFPWPPQTVDVMQLCRERLNVIGKRDVKNVRLETAYEAIIGNQLIDAHDALADAMATFQIYAALAI